MTALKYQSVGGRAKEIFRFIENAARPAVERMKARGANKTVRVMVVGIPNVGKSTFINHLRGAAVAKTSDRPGVTRSNQWVKITPYLELLDTPGMLWPKLEDQGARACWRFWAPFAIRSWTARSWRRNYWKRFCESPPRRPARATSCPRTPPAPARGAAPSSACRGALAAVRRRCDTERAGQPGAG